MCVHAVCRNRLCAKYIRTYRCFESFDQQPPGVDDNDDPSALRSCPKSRDEPTGRCETCFVVESAIDALEALVLVAGPVSLNGVQLERKAPAMKEYRDDDKDNGERLGGFNFGRLGKKQSAVVERMVRAMKGLEIEGEEKEENEKAVEDDDEEMKEEKEKAKEG